MNQASGDEFTDAMWQHMQKVNAAATDMLNKLRRENKQLLQELGRAKDRYYELFEENVAMREELTRRQDGGKA